MTADATLVLVHETEAACVDRLLRQGFPAGPAAEIASYLAQSTDLAPELPRLEAACAAHGLRFEAVTLDDFAFHPPRLDPARTVVWTLTDGIAYFAGSLAPALARFAGHATIGAEASVFALCQDKFRSGAVLSALGLPLPPTALARNGEWLSPPEALAGASGYFVKPNRLGAKIGIWPDSRTDDLGHALDLSRRIHAAYRDDAVVQAYVPGANLRASFLDVDGRADLARMGIWSVETGADFQTMADSLALYGETGAAARAEGRYVEPTVTDLRVTAPAAAAEVVAIARRLTRGLDIRDVFSMDLRLSEDGRPTLIEFEICPGLPCFDFRSYVEAEWRMDLAEAMARTAARRLADISVRA